MKLGTETNSLTNHLYARAVNGQPEPQVGMGATILAWTDRYAGTITEVRPNGVITVQDDQAIRVDQNGMSECHEYRYEPNPRGPIRHFRRRRNGVWSEVEFNPETNRWKFSDGLGLRIGDRHHYHDYSF